MAEASTGQAQQQPAIPESLNPHEAVGILSQMLESGQIQENGAPGEPEKVSPQPRNERGQFQKDAPKEEAQPETEAETEEPKEEAKEETPAEPEAPKFTLKLNYKGEERELAGEEQIREYAQKGYDYTQKMQALSKERADLEAKVKADAEAARKQYEGQLETHKKALQQIAGVKTMAEIEQLARTDPVAAQQEFLRMVAVNQAIGAIDAEQGKIQAQRQTEARDSLAKQAREAVEKLQERVPGWNDELYSKILKHAVSNYGFQQQEVNAITDHRAIEVLNKARLYDELQAAKPKTVEKKVPPVAPKVQKPGAGEEAKPKPNKLQEGMARLTKTGNRNDAVDVVREMIEQGML